METRLTNAAAQPNMPPPRHDPPPVRDAVPTDLPVPLAVSAIVGAEKSSKSANLRGSLFQESKAESNTLPSPKESLMETDRETGDLIYKVIDPETRKTVTQYPAEALLRLRAYIRTVDQKNENI